MSSQHIEDYALIGDLRTGALVGRDGSLDWLSFPRFDSPSVFANLVGEESNGFWRIAPSNARARVRREYRDRSLVLETHWTTAQGAARVLDFMPLNNDHSQVVRIVEGLAGDVAMTMTLAPRMGYGRRTPALSDRVDGGTATIPRRLPRRPAPLHPRAIVRAWIRSCATRNRYLRSTTPPGKVPSKRTVATTS